ncbi:MAG: DUF4105 domain-containing protein [Oceanospirillaceae bacterium]|nr:DUF4105 domain-containing protein [Oceanospirillaceae bacterium]
MLLRTFTLMVCLLSSLHLQANTADPSWAWQQQADRLALQRHPVWLKLLHYEQDFTEKSGYRSAIHSTSFFQAEDGYTQPNAELIADIQAFFKPVESDPDTHAQCRFPARYMWLKQQIVQGSQSTIQSPEDLICPAYSQWTDNNSVTSLSVIYATGYLGNPASFYGHTFLKFNTTGSASSLLDKTINYGAVVPDAENPITYIFKGIFGGYIGGFSEVDYYFQNNNYGENELRDLWEYQLNLKSDSTQLVVAHTWEVIKKEYTYFFFRKNCAYRMAELIEVIEDVKIITPHMITMPQALIQSITSAEVDGSPLVKAVNYHPSRQTKLYEKYLSLNADEKEIVHRIVSHPEQLDAPDFQQRPVLSKQLIVDTLLDYLQFIRSPEERATDVTTPFYRRVLKERYRMPPGEPNIIKRSGSPPHQGRDPSLIQIAVVHNSESENGLLLSLRPAYYDVLDSDNSHVRDSALTMGKIELIRSEDKGTDLRSLTLVEIESINGAVTGLPEDNGSGWRLKAGLEQHDLACDSCLILRGQAYYGYSRRISSNVLLGGYAGGQLQENVQNNGHARAVATLFTNLAAGSNLSARLHLDAIKALDGNRQEQYNIGIQARQRLSQNTDIRFSYQKDRAEEFALTFGYYF